MKRAIILAIGLFFTVLCLSEANAWFGSKKKEAKPAQEESGQVAKPAAATQAAAVEVKKTDRQTEEQLRLKRALVEKKRNELNNSEWLIEMSPLSGKGKKETELITFKSNQVTAAGFAKKGFPVTNFTLSVQDDGTVVWETMQTSDKAGICFWRGEMDKTMQNMRGVLSYQIDPKTKQDYSFISLSRKSIPVSGK